MATRFVILPELQHRHISRLSSTSAAWLGTATAVVGWTATRDLMASWLWMWGLVAVLVAGHKAIVLANASPGRDLAANKKLGFLLGWPGLSLRPFLVADCRGPSKSWIVWGVVNVCVGGGLLWGVTRFAGRYGNDELQVWTGLIGMSLLMHFGVIQVVAGLWRRAGVPVPKLWDSPLKSATLAEFWSRRWNRAFHEFVRDQVCRPLRDHIGSNTALAAGFLYSGLVHELVLSLPARGGYGMPTAYFGLQGLGVWCQRRFDLLKRPVVGWLWTLGMVLLPLPLVFHEPFRREVVLPFLAAIGATG